MSKQPISTHKNARYINENCDVKGRVLFNAMLELAESNSEYEDSLLRWLNKKESTVYLRDVLCLPFQNVFYSIEKKRINELAWYNAFTILDSASLRFH